MDHEYSRILTDVIRVAVNADSVEHAEEKAIDYAELEGYNTPPEVVEVFKNPHLKHGYAVYLTAVK